MNDRRGSIFFGVPCLAGIVLASAGCLQRTVTINSEPSGADVYLNDTHIGRTPAKADFLFYGDYDLRVRKAGYEPVITHVDVNMPLYELPPIDLLASAWPGNIRTNQLNMIALQPQTDGRDPESRERLLDRARAMQAQLPATQAEAPAGKGDASGSDASSTQETVPSETKPPTS